MCAQPTPTRPPLLATSSLETTLLDLALLFGLCIVVASLFHRLRMPPIVGFLAAGALLGPNAFGLVGRPDLVEQLAEIGVIVLLFTVGMELSVAQLVRIGRPIVVAGGIQLAGTIGLGALCAILGGLSWERAVFLGFLLSLSSTAAITRLLTDRGELSTPSGRMSVAVCVAQDLAVVPMILAIPILGSAGESGFAVAAVEMLRAFALLAIASAVAWWIAPRVLGHVSRTRSRELFVLAVIVLCLAMALTTAALGLSLALGAFLAGVIIGSTDFHHQASSEVEPFRDALSSLFFVSIGMLFDIGVVVEAPLVVAAAFAAVVLGKAAIAHIAVRAVGMPRWIASRTGLMLAQVGEFSFVIAQVARRENLLTDRLESIFLVVAVMSIAATPMLFALGRRGFLRGGRDVDSERDGTRDRLADHAIVVGYGPAGQNVARTLASLDLPYQVVEMNQKTVEAQRAAGVPITFGDASRVSVMRGVGLARARLLVVTVNDPGATLDVIALARATNPRVQIVARAMFLSEVEALRSAGADDVVPQELETTVELTVLAMRRFLVPDDEVGRQVRAIRRRAFGIEKLAPKAPTTAEHIDQLLPGLQLRVFRVEAGSQVAGRRLADSDLRRNAGVNVVAYARDGRVEFTVGGQTQLEADDVVVAIGPAGVVDNAGAMFRGPGLADRDLDDDVPGSSSQ